MSFRDLHYKTCSTRRTAANILFCISTLSASLSVFAAEKPDSNDRSDELLQINNSLLVQSVSLQAAQSIDDYSWFNGKRQFELNTDSDHRALFNPREPEIGAAVHGDCLLYTSPSPRDKRQSRMPSSA